MKKIKSYKTLPKHLEIKQLVERYNVLDEAKEKLDASNMTDMDERINQSVEILNKKNQLINRVLKLLTPQETNKILTNMNYREIDLRREFPMIRTGRFLKHDLKKYEETISSMFKR